ncbi:MAG TPA: BMP family protein [Capillimicrobium sp.]|nr:BMP family protein [Capillimicrobium sp.]
MSRRTPTTARRRLPSALLALLALVALLAVAAGCGSDSGESEATAASPSADTPAAAATPSEPLKVALLTSGLTNDGGFNQWAAEALGRLEDEGLVEAQIRQQLSDPTAAEPVLREFASRGYDLVIGHGIDLSEATLKVARQFPDVHFATTGDNTLEDKLLPNVDGWTYDFGQFGYIAGFVAGTIEGADRVGVVGGPQIPFVEIAGEGFAAGLHAQNPKAEISTTYTGEFYDSQKEQEATRGLIEDGNTLIFANTAEGNGVAPAAQAGGAWTIGVAVKGSPAAKDVNITSPSLNLYPVYKAYVDEIHGGDFGGRFTVGSIANEQIGIEPVNRVSDAVPADLQEQVDRLAKRLASGDLELPDFS